MKNSLNDYIGKKFNRLFVLGISDKRNNKGERLLRCLCDCGNEQFCTGYRLAKSKLKSCGCFRKEFSKKICENRIIDIINKRFGKLLVKSFSHSISKNRFYNTLCDCGNSKIVSTSNLIHNNTKSCGNCSNKVKGRNVSFVQLKLHKLLNRGVVNFKTNKKSIDIALVYNGKKIAIEYDSWYWHSETKEKDKQRVNLLISNGWRVLSIKSRYKVPTYNNLWKAIEQLSNNEKYIELTLDDWK